MQRPLNILVIDDQEMHYLMVEDFLRAAWKGGFAVTWSATYEDAKVMFKNNNYDVCLVDYELNDKSGLDFIKEMTAEGCTVPMILLTGHGNRSIDLQAMAAGAVDYLDKTDLRAATLERALRYAVERAHTLQKLHESENRQRHVLSTVPAGVFICQDGRFVYVNEMMGVITHHRMADLLQMRLLDIIHPDLHLTVQKWLPTAQQQASPSQAETLILTKDGQERWVSLTMSLIHTEGQPQILGAIVNVTKQKQTQQILLENERRFRALVENGSDIITILDHQNNITYISPSVQRILGYLESQFHNQQWMSFFHPKDFEQVQAQLEAIKAQPEATMSFEARIRHESGEWRWLESVVTNLLHEPSVVGIIVNARDITQSKLATQVEHEQRTLAEALLDTSNALNSTLEFDEVLERILSNVGSVIPHNTANIMLIQDGFTHVAGYRGYNPELERRIRRTRLYVEKTPELLHMVQTHKPMLIPDLAQHDRTLTDTAFKVLRSYIGAPILISDEVIGFINLSSYTPGFFTDAQAQRLQIFANQAAIAIRNAQAYEQAQALATLEERQRLARDLHDAVSQTLFSASVIAETLPRLMENNPDEVRNGLQKLSRMNRGALAEMRALLVELRPKALMETDLHTLLQHLTNAAASRIDARIELALRGRKITLPPEVQVAMYRITQEALNNIVKHSRASEVEIIINGQDESVELLVKDNGCGFDPHNIPPDHMGVRIMHERAQAIEMSIHIESAPGAGTCLSLIWPAKDAAP